MATNTTAAPDEAPYTSVVGLLATFSDGSVLQFSGTVIAPGEVLTAAHGVYQQGIGAAVAIVALPQAVPEADAMAGSEVVFQSGIYAEDFHYNAIDDTGDELTEGATQSDYALVNFGTALGTAPVFQLNTTAVGPSTPVRIAGLPDGGPEVTAAGQVSQDGSARALTGLVSLDPGSSGGPIWINGPGGVPTIVGTVSTDLYASEVTAGSVTQIDGWEALDAAPDVTDSATPASGANLLTLTGNQAELTSFGRDTIEADAGAGIVYAAGPSVSVLGGSGSLVVVGGAGTDTVRPGGGTATLFGGSGGGIFDAGYGGASDVIGGSGAATLVGGGNGDLLFCSAATANAATAGAGAETIVGGNGPDSLTGGSGSTVVFAGVGADTVSAWEALGGTLSVVGYHAADTLELNTIDGGPVSTSSGAYGSTFTFQNGSQVVLFGVTTPPAALVS